MNTQEKKSSEFIPLTYIKLFGDTADKVKFLSDEELGRLVRGILHYAQTGVAPGTDDLPGNERYVFPFFRCDVDREQVAYKKKCKANRINGLKGGRPPKGAGKVQDASQKPTETQEQEYEQGQDHDQEQKQPQEQAPGHPKDHSHTKDHIQGHPTGVDVVDDAYAPAVHRNPPKTSLPF